MKKSRLVQFLSLIICGTFFLSSCGSFKDQFSHQRYTNFKVKHDGNYAKQDVSSNASSPTIKENNESSTKVSTPTVLTASADSKSTSVETPEKIVRQNNLNSESKKHKEVIKLENKIEFKNFFTPAVIENKKGDAGEVNTVLLILLCIFIPPLACYLKDGAVSTAFWITLICCLLSFSYFAFQGGGIFWLVAMIVAFVHCFK